MNRELERVLLRVVTFLDGIVCDTLTQQTMVREAESLRGELLEAHELQKAEERDKAMLAAGLKL